MWESVGVLRLALLLRFKPLMRNQCRNEFLVQLAAIDDVTCVNAVGEERIVAIDVLEQPRALVHLAVACAFMPHLPCEIAALPHLRVRHKTLDDARLAGFASLLALIYADLNPLTLEAGRCTAGTKKCWWLTSIVKPMREELADLLGIFRRQPMQWKDKFLAGDEIPLWWLVDQYEAKGNERMATTLKSLAAHESCKALVERLGLPKTTIHMLRRNAHVALNEAYGCTA